MAKDDKKEPKAPVEAAPAPQGEDAASEEAALLAQLEAEQAALTAAAAASVQVAPVVEARPPAPKPKIAGDVDVRVLKDSTSGTANMGKRVYRLKKGQVVQMHPSHAAQLQKSGWVAILK